MPDYTVKNVKSFMGLDFPGYNATLYCDGKAVATVINDGGGGETEIHWNDYREPRVDVPWINYKDEPFTIHCTPEEAKLYEHIRGKTWSMPEIDSKVHQHGLDTYIGELVEEVEHQKKVIAQEKRWIKKETVFHLKGQKEGSFHTIKMPFCKRVKDFLVNKYGNEMEYILNERHGQEAL